MYGLMSSFDFILSFLTWIPAMLQMSSFCNTKDENIETFLETRYPPPPPLSPPEI